MKATLVGHGYEVTEARTGEEALEGLAGDMPNLILLDMNMPGMGGLETCRAIRAGSDTPVIILSVRNTEKDKVAALDAGAEVRLPPKEFELLRYLVAHAGKPVTHRELLQAVWGPDYGDEPEYLRVFVNQVRKKIEPNPGKPRYILTEPWVGYKFV